MTVPAGGAGGSGFLPPFDFAAGGGDAGGLDCCFGIGVTGAAIGNGGTAAGGFE